MFKKLVACMLLITGQIVFGPFAQAEEVPVRIQKALKPFKIQSIDFSSGVLRVVMSVPMVNWETYWAVSVVGVCSTLFDDKKTAARITKIEVLNDIDAQGYALEDAGKACLAIAPMYSDQTKKYISDHTVTCIAGNCRKR